MDVWVCCSVNAWWFWVQSIWHYDGRALKLAFFRNLRRILWIQMVHLLEDANYDKRSKIRPSWARREQLLYWVDCDDDFENLRIYNSEESQTRRCVGKSFWNVKAMCLSLPLHVLMEILEQVVQLDPCSIWYGSRRGETLQRRSILHLRDLYSTWDALFSLRDNGFKFKDCRNS